MTIFNLFVNGSTDFVVCVSETTCTFFNIYIYIILCAIARFNTDKDRLNVIKVCC